ncbi:MAG: ATP-binding protein [Endomicrobiia bacterium]
MKKTRFPFFLKFILIFISLSTIPLIVASIQSTKILKPALRTIYLELHTKTISNIATKINTYFETLSSVLPFIEEVISKQDISWDNKQRILETLINVNKNIVSISILDINGKEKIKIYNPNIIIQPSLEDLSNTKYFKNLKNTNLNNILSTPYFYENSYIIDSFYKKSNFYIRICLSLNYLFEQLQQTKVGNTGFIFIFDIEENSLIFTNYNSPIKNIEEILPRSINQLAKQSVSVGSKEFNLNNTEYIVSYISLPLINWVVFLRQQQQEAYFTSNILTKQTTRLILFLIFISSLVSFLIATGISKPILKIINAAKIVASGNFNVKINIKTFDELEILGETFNYMAKKLNEYAEIQLDKLIAEKTKTEAIIFSIKDGIILTNYNGEILLINNKAKEILGLQEKENLENLNIFNLLDERIKPIFESAINEPNKIFELNLSDENLSKYYQTISIPVVTSQKKEKIGIVTVLHDITLEKELDKMKEDFLHSITHDLRNPMTSLRGFIKFLYDGVGGPINEQQKKMLETMDRASFKLLNMINDILDIAKLEAGKLELYLEKINLIQIINSVKELLHPQYTRKNIKLILDIPQNNDVIIYADGKLLERVYINLIGNAIKFTPEGGEITVGVEENESLVRSYVKDTGEGIPKEYLDKIFEKFGQVKGKSRGGTGLGLTICKYIIEAHKGKIWVESELSKGSKFSFELPKN